MLLLLVACSVDYGVSPNQDEEPVPETETTDTGTLTHTGDTGDTGDTAAATDTLDLDEDAATEPVYVNTSSALYSFDPKTGVYGKVGNFSCDSDFDGMTDIAIDLDGKMMGVAFERLYTIDARDASCTYVATVPYCDGLTFLSDGRLVGTGEGVFFIDTRNGSTEILVEDGHFDSSGDIVGLPDGLLYWTVRGGDDLVVVDPRTGTAGVLSDLGVEKVFGLGYADGQLFGFTSQGQRIVIDGYTGETQAIEAMSGGWWGATTNPVRW